MKPVNKQIITLEFELGRFCVRFDAEGRGLLSFVAPSSVLVDFALRVLRLLHAGSFIELLEVFAPPSAADWKEQKGNKANRQNPKLIQEAGPWAASPWAPAVKNFQQRSLSVSITTIERTLPHLLTFQLFPLLTTFGQCDSSQLLQYN